MNMQQPTTEKMEQLNNPFHPATVSMLKMPGITARHLKVIETNPNVREEIAKLLLRNDSGGPVDAKVARTAFSEDESEDKFFGALEWDSHFGIKLFGRTDTEDSFPWGMETLEESCPFTEGKKVFETHIAFYGAVGAERTTLSSSWKNCCEELIDVRSLPKKCRLITQSNSIAERIKVQPRWYLMPTDQVLTDMAYTDQLASIPKGYETASATEETMKHLLFRRLNGEFSSTGRSRCKDLMNGFEDNHVTVDVTHYDGLQINREWMYGNPESRLGLALSKQIPTEA